MICCLLCGSSCSLLGGLNCWIHGLSWWSTSLSIWFLFWRQFLAHGDKLTFSQYLAWRLGGSRLGVYCLALPSTRFFPYYHSLAQGGVNQWYSLWLMNCKPVVFFMKLCKCSLFNLGATLNSPYKWSLRLLYRLLLHQLITGSSTVVTLIHDFSENTYRMAANPIVSLPFFSVNQILPPSFCFDIFLEFLSSLSGSYEIDLAFLRNSFVIFINLILFLRINCMRYKFHQSTGHKVEILNLMTLFMKAGLKITVKKQKPWFMYGVSNMCPSQTAKQWKLHIKCNKLSACIFTCYNLLYRPL